MKKVIISIFISILFVTCWTQLVYADSTWVQDAFADARSFFGEHPHDDLGIGRTILNLFKDFVRAVNLIFIVVLAGLSAISLSITGVRYIAAGAVPSQRNIARQNLRRVFIAMCYGFGAFMIWRISMGIVTLIISSF